MARPKKNESGQICTNDVEAGIFGNGVMAIMFRSAAVLQGGAHCLIVSEQGVEPVFSWTVNLGF